MSFKLIYELCTSMLMLLPWFKVNILYILIFFNCIVTLLSIHWKLKYVSCCILYLFDIEGRYFYDHKKVIYFTSGTNNMELLSNKVAHFQTDLFKFAQVSGGNTPYVYFRKKISRYFNK